MQLTVLGKPFSCCAPEKNCAVEESAQEANVKEAKMRGRGHQGNEATMNHQLTKQTKDWCVHGTG